jgi:thymidine phosphorylase
MKNSLILRQTGIDTYREAVMYLRTDSPVCISEGFDAQARVQINYLNKSIIATLNKINSNLLEQGEIGLSEYAWNLLGAKEGDLVTVNHPRPINSMSFVRSKIYGNKLQRFEFKEILDDIVSGRYSDIQITSFLTACSSSKIDFQEIMDLTQEMVLVGEQIKWHSDFVVDKHCVGGLAGNRTTPIVVPIVSEFGLIMPKTSSRAITSPAGTADTMEVFAPVNLTVSQMKKVVEKENGCIVWGGAVSLSPADDILIRVERVLDLDSEGQLVASVLSKKIAAGSSHVLIDIPIGPSAKVRNETTGNLLKLYFEKVGEKLGIKINVYFTDGTQPVGNGIGPALEARDILSVLSLKKDAPLDLRNRSLEIAAKILEFSPKVKKGEGFKIATDILQSGRALKKFESICLAQGGFGKIPHSKFLRPYLAKKEGIISAIDNRHISRLAKLAGAPTMKSAGVDLHILVGAKVEIGTPLFTIHGGSKGELDYALAYLKQRENDFITIKEN